MDDALDVAVLFAEPRGVYSTFDGVDLWDEVRDARRYQGPTPRAFAEVLLQMARTAQRG